MKMAKPDLIPFIQTHRHSEATALFDDEQAVSYRALSELIVQRQQEWLSLHLPKRSLVMLIIGNSIASVVDYLAALSLDWVMLLVNPSCDEDIRKQYCDAFKPNAVIQSGELIVCHCHQSEMDDDVSVLLSTSGSTGAGKCVALSKRNLVANAKSILAYLPVESTDITLATMPLSYSYGLSVLHTHLIKGACTGFTAHTVFDKAFWTRVKSLPVHSLAGVPSFYEMLLRLRFTRMALPDLRYFTQAGGRLSPENVEALGLYAKEHDKQFFVMYGQTEATARMAFLAPEKVLDKPDSIGQAIPGGQIELRSSNTQSSDEGELYYHGDNVMLGYAENNQQLASFSPEAWLATGDIARRDADGDLFIIGRTKRIIKVAGERVNLDALEQYFSDDDMQVRCIGKDNLVVLITLDKQLPALKEKLTTQSLLPARNVTAAAVENWPYLANGKPDYQQLASLVLKEQ